MKSITLIGSGRLARPLGIALARAGYMIDAVFSPTKEHAITLAAELSCLPLHQTKDLPLHSDFYVLAIKDEAIGDLAKQLHFSDSIVLHTSGSIPMNILSDTSSRYGVLYPLQTFSKERMPDFFNIPLFVEGNNEDTQASIMELAFSISDEVYELDSEKRKALHVAAVFASNFSNHLYHLAGKILAEEGLNFDVLRPLILETALKTEHLLPAQAQTGPANRGDHKTIQAHLEYLESSPDLQNIYRILSDSIIKSVK